MLKKLLMGVAVLSVLGSVAYAENSAINPPAPDQQNTQTADNGDDGQPPPPPRGDDEKGGWWGWSHRGHHGDRRMGEHGGPGGRGPGMMMMGNHQGFRLQLGKGVSVGVMCGKDTNIKDCVAAAQPLIDAAKAVATAQTGTKL